MEHNTHVISGLRDKRAAVAGRIVDLRREMDKLQADLLHLDAVLKLYGLEPAEIPDKGRMPVRVVEKGGHGRGVTWQLKTSARDSE